jgi:hypothetical protein
LIEESNEVAALRAFAEAQAMKEANEKTMLMKILTSDGFH